MSITISLPYLGILVVLFLCAPLICAVTTILTNRWETRLYRRDMAQREKELNRQIVRVQDREKRVSRREEKVSKQEEKVRILGREAHDFSTQTKLAMSQHDTVISLKGLDDWRI